MDDVYIYAVELPSKIKGTVIERSDDIIVFVNANLTKEEQDKAVKHELKHVADYHVRDMRNVAELEREASMAV